jgi:hypothetical protein
VCSVLSRGVLSTGSRSLDQMVPHQKKASTGVVSRDNWKQANECIIFPVDPWKEAWDITILFLILYSAITVPLRLCFSAEAVGSLFMFETMMSITFVMCVPHYSNPVSACLQTCTLTHTYTHLHTLTHTYTRPGPLVRALPRLRRDVGLNFFTAVLVDGNWMVGKCEITKKYITGWFWIDAPGSIPFELLTILGVNMSNMRASQPTCIGTDTPLSAHACAASPPATPLLL